jgi:hypothetical protein
LPVIGYSSNNNGVNGGSTFIKLFASDAYIKHLFASDIESGKFTTNDAIINQLTVNTIGSSDTVYFTSPFEGKLGSISSLTSNGVYLTGQSTNKEALLYSDSSLTLYWNGMPLIGYSSNNNAISGGSTFNKLYASDAYIKHLFSSDIESGKLIANEVKLNKLTVNTIGSSSTVYFTSPFEGNEASISTIKSEGVYLTGQNTTSEALLYSDSSLTLYWNGIPLIGYSSNNNSTNGGSTFNKLYASDAYIKHLFASDIESGKQTTNEAVINQLTVNTIGSSDTVYFTSPFESKLGSISSLTSNGIYLTGQSTNNEALLYSDSSLTLYWNGIPLIGYSSNTDGVSGGSTFNKLYASDAYIKHLFASDIESGKLTAKIGAIETLTVQTLGSSDTVYFRSPFVAKEGSISTIKSNGLYITGESTSKDALFYSDSSLTLYWNGRPLGNNQQGSSTFNKLFASDAYIRQVFASDMASGTVTSKNANITELTVNVIGSSDTVYFKSPLYAKEGAISTLKSDGVYLTGQKTSEVALFYADSSLTLYWNNVPIIQSNQPTLPQLSPVFTNKTTTEANLLNYKIVRVSLSGGILNLPNGIEDTELKIYNVLEQNLYIYDSSNNPVVGIYKELISLIFSGGEWFYY